MDHSEMKSEFDGQMLRINQSSIAAPVNYDLQEPNFERVIKQSTLSHRSEIQLDRVVNRLFEDAGRKKLHRDKI